MAAMATIEFTTCRSANDGEYIALRYVNIDHA